MSNIEFVTRFNQLESLLQASAIQLTKNKADAQDLVQETAFKAFKYWDHYQPQTNLKAWLTTIMRNTFINDYRKRKRRQTIHDRTLDYFNLERSTLTVLNKGESNISLEELENLMDKVEEWARVPFLLHFQGYKYEEIAQDLDIPLGTVKSRIFFARKKMKELIADSYHSPAMGTDLA